MRSRVEKFLNEKTGRMTTMKTPAVILDDVWCKSRYSSCRMFCPRSIYSWWRENWLERVEAASMRSQIQKEGLSRDDNASRRPVEGFFAKLRDLRLLESLH